MAVTATLVVGSNNATTIRGSSIGLSTSADRARFLALHRSAGAIITGKQSAEKEDYRKTDVPIYIFTRHSASFVFAHPQMRQVTVGNNLAQTMRDLELRIHSDVVIEAGPQLLDALVAAGTVDQLQLSIVPVDGDGNFIDLNRLMSFFLIENDEVIDGTRLLQCRYDRNATDR